ncbi:MAG: amphi-Trp domain-containing protein [Thermodesulfobacteriota bacterium]
MTSGMDRFKHESLEDSESIVKYLNALREGFEKGVLLFSSESKRLTIKPHGLINFDMEARRKGDDIKVTLKFRWSEAQGSGLAKNKSLHIQPLSKA